MQHVYICSTCFVIGLLVENADTAGLRQQDTRTGGAEAAEEGECAFKLKEEGREGEGEGERIIGLAFIMSSPTGLFTEAGALAGSLDQVQKCKMFSVCT